MSAFIQRDSVSREERPSKFKTQPELNVKKPNTFSDNTHELITENNKMYIPKALQHRCAKCYHLTLMDPGKQRSELTVAQHYTWIGLCETCQHVCKRCHNCAASKERDKQYGMLPPKPTPEIIQWCALCMHLVGPCEFGNKKKPETHIKLHCLITVSYTHLTLPTNREV